MLAGFDQQLPGEELALSTAVQIQPQQSQALHALLAELVDYAGLFPPAGLAMGDGVRSYAAYRKGEDAWALGRFVTPVARFVKFEAAFAGLPPQTGIWRLAALLGQDIAVDLAAIAEFNLRMAGKVVVDVVEAKVGREREIKLLASLLPSEMNAYCEVEPSRRDALLKAVKLCGLRAKLRTGGVTPDAIPEAEEVADFLLACARHGIAFKATAGLHHPVRCVRSLTYEADAPRATMHGFLNVFLAAQMAREGREYEEIVTLLLENDVAAFSVSGSTVQWRKRRFTEEQLQSLRKEFAISFGSCSFEEPLADLHEAGLL